MRFLYPWDEWFTSGHFVLREHREYKCSTLTMHNNIRTTAVRRRLKVSVIHSTDRLGDVITVTVKKKSA